MKFILEAKDEYELADILRNDGRSIHELLLSDVKACNEPNWRLE